MFLKYLSRRQQLYGRGSQSRRTDVNFSLKKGMTLYIVFFKLTPMDTELDVLFPIFDNNILIARKVILFCAGIS